MLIRRRNRVPLKSVRAGQYPEGYMPAKRRQRGSFGRHVFGKPDILPHTTEVLIEHDGGGNMTLRTYDPNRKTFAGLTLTLRQWQELIRSGAGRPSLAGELLHYKELCQRLDAELVYQKRMRRIDTKFKGPET